MTGGQIGSVCLWSVAQRNMIGSSAKLPTTISVSSPCHGCLPSKASLRLAKSWIKVEMLLIGCHQVLVISRVQLG